MQFFFAGKYAPPDAGGKKSNSRLEIGRGEEQSECQKTGSWIFAGQRRGIVHSGSRVAGHQERIVQLEKGQVFG